MGGKKSSPPAPKPEPPREVMTPNVDLAEVAATKALAAQGNLQGMRSADAANAADEEKKRGRRPGELGRTGPRERDPAAVANSVGSGTGMASSAILTG